MSTLDYGTFDGSDANGIVDANNTSNWGSEPKSQLGQMADVNPCPVTDCKCPLTTMVLTEQLNIERMFVAEPPSTCKSHKNRCVKCTTEWYDFTLPKCKKCGIVFKYDEEFKISTKTCGHIKKQIDCHDVKAMAFASNTSGIIVNDTSPTVGWFKRLFCCCVI